VSIGSGQTLPNFEANLYPRSDKSRGKYYCILNARSTTTDITGKDYYSNMWTSSSFAALPSIFLTMAMAAIMAVANCK